MTKQFIQTPEAPEAIGCYSQAVRVENTVYFSGQIPLDPQSGQVVSPDFRAQTEQVFKNIRAVAKAAGGSLENIVKLTVYLIDMKDFAIFNEVMATYFVTPYPARTSIAVAALPKAVSIEVEALMIIN